MTLCKAKTAPVQHATPPPGAWLRPIGRLYGYCLKVLCAHPSDSARSSLAVLECERWGRDDSGLPLRDGHQHITWERGLQQVLPGVWRDTSSARWGSPRYYRLMPPAMPRGQIDLFA